MYNSTMWQRIKDNVDQRTNYSFRLTISFKWFNRQQFIEDKFQKSIKKYNTKTLEEQIRLALRQMSGDDFLIVEIKGEKPAYVQYAITTSGCYFNYRVTVRTWDYRHIYWRYLSVLERHGYKPYKYHRSQLYNDLFNRKRYYYQESSTLRDIEVFESLDNCAKLGGDCLKIGHGITDPNDVIFIFGSWKKWWEWV